MGGGSGGLKRVWVAIILLGAPFIGGAVAHLFWGIGHGDEIEGRVKDALTAGGATFLGLASLGLTVSIFLSSGSPRQD